MTARMPGHPADLVPPRTPIFLRTTAPSRPEMTTADRFHACVRNTGNYFFEKSLQRQLRGVRVANTLEDLPRHIECLVLSMSNFISPTTDLGYLHEALARHRIDQVVMIGVGAQAYAYGDPIALTDGTIRFLRFVADRSTSIGVRGCYTAEILNELGIRNLEVVGCPSAFWSDTVPAIRPNPLPQRPRVAVHTTPLGHFRDKVSALMAHGMRHGADYVLQSEAWMMPLLGASDDTAALEEGLLYYSYPCCDPAELRRWLTRQLRVFFNLEEWLDRMTQYDFVYGSRFHGNMAAIQAGVPALNMPFDTRTRELCEYLNLPTMPLTEFHDGMDLRHLRDRADFGLFTRTYPAKRLAYADFLRRNGLQHAMHAQEAAAPVDRATRVRARTLAQLMLDLPDQAACPTPWLTAGLAERLHLERSPAARVAAETGCFDRIDDKPSLASPASPDPRPQESPPTELRTHEPQPAEPQAGQIVRFRNRNGAYRTPAHQAGIMPLQA